MSTGATVRRLYGFGPYVLDPVRRRLLVDDAPTQLSPKAFDTLVLLVENRGRVVEKDELMRTLWPDTVVEETNLNVQISALRKALGENPSDRRFIVTVPKRGYTFVADVTEIEAFDEGAGEVVPEVRTMPSEAASRARWPRGLAIGIGAGLVWLVARTSPEVAGRRASVAVLPFRSLTGEQDGSLGIGLTDALITRLSTAKDLIVRPTTAVLAYESTATDPVQAGRELQVRTVLDGRIQRQGERVRVTVQLLDVDDGATLWSETFDQPAADVFALQDAIADQVARSLDFRVSTIEGAKRSALDPEAYALYLRGRYHWNRRTDEDIRIAMEYHRRALAVDVGFALARSGLADCYSLLSTYGGTPPAESFPRAREEALAALAADDALPEAHASLGYILMRRDRDWAGARREFERAIELNPGYATAHHWYGWLLMLLGDTDEALARLRRAEQIDPLSLSVRSDVAWALYFARRYDEAAAQCANVLRFDPVFRAARQCLAHVYIQQGRYEEALNECRIGGIEGSSTEGIALARSGRTADAMAVVARHRDAFHVGRQAAYEAALVLVALDSRKSLLWLDKSFEAGEERIGYIRIEPGFDGLRQESEFQEMLARLEQ